MMFGTNCPNDTDLMRCLGSSCLPVDLDCGDVCFLSCDNRKIVIERKKIPDMISCITTGRYLSQCQAAKEDGADQLILILEGQYRPNQDDGLVEVPGWGRVHKRPGWTVTTPAITYSRLTQYLFELDYLAGISVIKSHDVHETASIIKAIYTNFQLPPDKHNSLHQIYTQPTPVQLRKPSLVRRMSFCIDGIGWDRSGAVDTRFKTPVEMVSATEQDWEEIDGIGKTTAKKVIKQLQG